MFRRFNNSSRLLSRGLSIPSSAAIAPLPSVSRLAFAVRPQQSLRWSSSQPPHRSSHAVSGVGRTGSSWRRQEQTQDRNHEQDNSSRGPSAPPLTSPSSSASAPVSHRFFSSFPPSASSSSDASESSPSQPPIMIPEDRSFLSAGTAAALFSMLGVGAVASRVADDEEALREVEETKARKKKAPGPISGPGVRPQLAMQLAQECLAHVPGWKDLKINQISVSVLEGGLSNQLFEVAVIGEAAKPLELKKVVVRLFNEQSKDLVIREVEAYVTELLNGRDGLGADVVYVFPDGSGRIEKYIRGDTLTWDSLRSEYKEVGKLMARIHNLKAEGPLADRDPQLYRLLEDWLKLATQYLIGTEDADVHVMVRRLREERWGEEIEFLREYLSRHDSPIVFSHNDLQAGNFMKGKDGLTVIDFEYSGYNFRGFDLGNYFCELYLDNFYTTPPYFRLNLERVPDEQFARAYVQNYLETGKRLLAKANDDPNPTPEVSEEEIRKVVEEARHYMMASHLMWSFWAVVQARSGEKANFGYIQYAEARLSEYLRLKRKFLIEDREAKKQQQR